MPKATGIASSSAKSSSLAPAWHELVKLRPELESGELTLAMFAADLYDVAAGEGAVMYRDPREFFSLTYPTVKLRDLARDVAARLAQASDKAVRVLARTYGGGKSHTLITLYHLFGASALPSLPAVEEFRQHVGRPLPPARIATLTFDKLDAERGMEARDPQGNRCWLKFPWSVLAWQLAGERGLRLLHAKNEPEERETPPAENLLGKLLAPAFHDHLPALILMDEVLMYAHTMAGKDPVWRGRLENFFQCLTQAAVKAPGCAIVASLLATDPGKADELGRQILAGIYTIFGREREAEVQPVEREDVAEILRRRLFTPESLRDHARFRPAVVAAVNSVAALDGEVTKERARFEARFQANYPFHPGLLDVLYAKWSNVAGFQQTRGVLRTFAMALRQAQAWDCSPVVAAGVLLAKPGFNELSAALRELSTIAGKDSPEGKEANWQPILEGELEKARRIDAETAGLTHRETEQAVVGVFLHSLPLGQRAATPELVQLLGANAAGLIELNKGLRRWIELSWFLDEEAMAESSGGGSLPKFWRLGLRPNLRQMHAQAMEGIPASMVDARLEAAIAKTAVLTEGAQAAGAIVHKLPRNPADIEKDAEFHYLLLGLAAASKRGEVRPLVRRFFDETTGADRPRELRNCIVIALPEADALQNAREAARSELAWGEVERQLNAEQSQLDPVRAFILAEQKRKAPERTRTAVQQAYSLFAAVSTDNKIEVLALSSDQGALFDRIVRDPRSRILQSGMNAAALLPGGPYSFALWREGETARRLQDLVEAFALNPKLPKLMGASAVRETMAGGCERGELALRLYRPDHSARIFWRQRPEDSVLRDSGLEVVLPQAALLRDIAPGLLAPGRLPGLWPGNELPVSAVLDYFSGHHVAKLEFGDELPVPGAEENVVRTAIDVAVAEGVVWFTSGAISLYKEQIPLGVLTTESILRPPPLPVATTAIVPAALPAAWREGRTTAAAIQAALAAQSGVALPWVVVAEAIDGALRARLLDLEVGSAWPAAASSAGSVILKPPPSSGSVSKFEPAPLPPSPSPGTFVARAQLMPAQIQDLAEKISEIISASAGQELQIVLQFTLGTQEGQSSHAVPREVLERLNQILAGIDSGLRLA